MLLSGIQRKPITRPPIKTFGGDTLGEGRKVSSITLTLALSLQGEGIQKEMLREIH
jgi:hypothetical protein